MKATINRPQQCPHYKMGIHYALCLYPTNTAPLRCDTAVTARKDDGFPIDCPLRKEAAE